MNHIDFGKLIASLRREHEDEEGRPWGQERLAAEANSVLGKGLFTTDIISNIERGKRQPDQATLLALATALQLTSGERREFFLAGSGVDNDRIVRTETDPEGVLSHMIYLLQQVRLPAHIVDSYCDIIAINVAEIDLLEFLSRGPTIEESKGRRFGYNEMRVAFSDEGAAHLSALMGQYWPQYAFEQTAFFRTCSLRYRATEYFQSLLKELRGYRWFKHYWWEANMEGQDNFVNTGKLWVNSPKWGPLGFLSSLYSAWTAAGDLHLTTFSPLTTETARVFWELRDETGPENTIRLDYSWPKKVVPPDTPPSRIGPDI